jgi:hypothetical protein
MSLPEPVTETTLFTHQPIIKLPQPYTVNGVTRIAQQNKFEAANISIDHFSTVRYPWYEKPAYTNDPMSPAGFLPEFCRSC